MSRKVLRKNSLCKVKEELQEDYIHVFEKNQTLLYLGDVANMPGHSILVTKAGKTIWGYHTENFIELSEDEL
jgi:hypothetical protein